MFTWDLPQAYSRAVWLREMDYHVQAGGPAVKLMPDYLADVAECNRMAVDALPWHNPAATFTSRGCIRRCPFCAVPKIEGDLMELDDWPVRPIVCDNNLLACSVAHFDKVVDRLKPLSGIDFNQGLDARLIDASVARKLAALRWIRFVRLACDSQAQKRPVATAINNLRAAGYSGGIFCYVLVTDIDDALDRVEFLRGLKVDPFAQPFRAPDGTPPSKEQRRFARWVNHKAIFKTVKWNEYRTDM